MIDFQAIRSMLFVPGSDRRKIEKALASEADALILDLEDAVAPDRKHQARQLCHDILRGKRNAPIFVRINAVTDEGMLDDLAAIVQGKPDGVMLPKCSSPNDLCMVDHALTALEVREGIARRSIAVLPIVVETAASVFNAGNYRGITSRLCGVMWGVEDIAVDIGSAVRNAQGQYLPAIELARSLCIFAAAAADVPAVDAVYADFKNVEGLAADVAEARDAGFSVKTAIHPSQLAIINHELTPGAETIAWANKVVKAFGDAPAQGAIAIDGKMHDRPHLKAAYRILKRGAKYQAVQAAS